VIDRSVTISSYEEICDWVFIMAHTSLLVAAQILIPPECTIPLQFAVMSDNLPDDELLAQRTKPRVLADLRINSESRRQGRSLE
jgi:hypothetical protein